MRFTAELEATGGTTTGFAVPESVVEGLDVEVVLDDAPREVELPPLLAEALAADDAARTFYESLSYSAQRGFAEPIGATSNPETAQRRLDKAMTALREGRKRP